VNAPRAAANLPLLLFSHGNCSLPTLSRLFMRAVVSYGFVVAAPLHPPGVIFTADTTRLSSAASAVSIVTGAKVLAWEWNLSGEVNLGDRVA